MLYIFETELNTNKPVFIALQQIFGIGVFTSEKICNSLGFSINYKIKDLTKYQYFLLLKRIDDLDLLLSSDLKKKITLNNSRYISIKSYRGLRKLQGLPIRGQRTHTNAKTARRHR